MIIRCERCSTLYELDEALLSQNGTPVQCTRCQAVFTARPGPKAAAKAPASPAAPRYTPPPAAGESPPIPAGPPRPQPQRSNVYRRPEPRGEPAVPPARRGTPPARGPSPGRDAVSAFEARLRAISRWKLAAVPAALVLLVLLVMGGWSLWKRRPDPETARLRAEAGALIAQDDAASLARALEILDRLQAGDHASRGAGGDRGLARVLQATAHAEEGEPLEEKLAAAAAERKVLEREQPPGFEDSLRTLAMEMTRTETALAPHRKQVEALTAQALEELQAVVVAGGAKDAARGLALQAAQAGDAEELARQVGLLRNSSGASDGWAELAECWAEVRRDGASRDLALPKLVKLVQAHPELIRARFVLARAQLAAGRREEASSTLVGLLAANPRHARAQRLRAQLSAPAPMVAPPAVVVVPPPPRPAWTPRQPPGPGVPVPGGPPITPPAAVNQPVVAGVNQLTSAAGNQAAAPTAAPEPQPVLEPAAPAPPPPAPPPPAPRPKPKPADSAPNPFEPSG